jgi:hypothetical protein
MEARAEEEEEEEEEEEAVDAGETVREDRPGPRVNGAW